MKRDLDRLLAAACRRGWSVVKTKRSHWRLQHVSGAIVIAASTPSCAATLRNVLADLRRVERRTP